MLSTLILAMRRLCILLFIVVPSRCFLPLHDKPQYSSKHDDVRHLQDFDWDIEREVGYPQFHFNGTGANEITLKYGVTGMNSPSFGVQKFLQATLFEANCVDRANDASITYIDYTNISLSEYTIDVNLEKETISTSPYYTALNVTYATINFCVRVDYNFFDGTNFMGINFHETNITVGVDLQAGFDLQDPTVDRQSADQAQANAKLDYPIIAYFCNESNIEQVPAPMFAQGSAMEICVTLDNSVLDQVYVTNIINLDLDQPASGLHSDPITNMVADQLTYYTCFSGVCNIKMQLVAKWFDSNPASPGPLQVTGQALLAYGISPVANVTRMLQISFDLTRLRGNRGKEETRSSQNAIGLDERDLLQLNNTPASISDPIEAALGKFGLKCDLQGNYQDDTQTGIYIVCGVVSLIAILLCTLCSYCFCTSTTTKTTITKITEEKSSDMAPVPHFINLQAPPPPPPMPPMFFHSHSQHPPPPPNYPPHHMSIVVQSPPHQHSMYASDRNASGPLTYNHHSHHYLGSSQRSITNQDYQDDEIMIVEVLPDEDQNIEYPSARIDLNGSGSNFSEEIVVVPPSPGGFVAVPAAKHITKTAKRRKSGNQEPEITSEWLSCSNVD